MCTVIILDKHVSHTICFNFLLLTYVIKTFVFVIIGLGYKTSCFGGKPLYSYKILGLMIGHKIERHISYWVTHATQSQYENVIYFHAAELIFCLHCCDCVCLVFICFYTPVWKTGRKMPWQCPSVCPSVRPRFPDFSSTCFEISIWNLVYTFSRWHDMSSLSCITIGSLWPSLQPKVGQTYFLQSWPHKSR